MQDLMPPINTPDSAFHDGDPTTGQLGTIVTALWLNNVQAATRDTQLEIKNVLTKAGIQPDPKKTNQLAEAISQIIGSGNYASTAYVDNGLNKKIDKANISSILGNDNDKVPSLGLITTELGKKQPAGNYAPAGDYATNTALTNGLDGKLDKTGGFVDGSVISSTLGVTRKTTNSTAYLYPAPDSQPNSYAYFQYKIGTDWFGRAEIPRPASGQTTRLMQVGDYGWGGGGVEINSTEDGVATLLKSGVTQIWRNNAQTTAFSQRYSPSFVCSAADAFFNISMSHSSGIITATSGLRTNPQNTWKIGTLYTTLNTTTDRNGNLKVSGSSGALSDFPVGSPIPWPQAATPAGFLVCNGQTFNKATYPLLAMAYPSGVLPDLRAEFIRGLDSGRNVDSARTVLSAQGDAIRDIEGGFTIDDQIPDTIYPPFGAFKVIPGMVNYDAASDRSGRGRKLEFKASYSGVPTANENRPRNIAFLYIVRAA